MTFEQLTVLKNDELERFMSGHPAPALAGMVGFDYRGWNIQAATAILGTRKFFKGFFGTQGQSHAWGYNMPAVQNAKHEHWYPKKTNGQVKRYYFYKVVDGSTLSDSVYPHTLVIDYRLWPGYSPLSPVKYTVDYLVLPDPQNDALIVGKSYSQLLGTKIFLGFFIIERWHPSGYSGPPGFSP
jgi:hypothetical protein